MDRESLLDDAQWELIEPLLPPQRSGKGRPMRDHRQVVEGVIYRYRCGIAWRDLPGSFGPWQTVWKRHRRFSGDGTWDKILAVLLARADAVEEIDWTVSVDSTINRAHQHATNLPRDGKPSPHADDADLADGEPAGPAAPAELDTVAGVVGLLAGDTGGWIESQEFARSPSSAGN
jgi:transposase